MAEQAGAGRESWSGLRERRMAEPGAEEAYEATRLAFELGAAVRECGWRGGGVRRSWRRRQE
jgi:hypothetical protein